MSGRILARNSKFGKQWPHRALNFLPPAQLWKYLIWKSGGATPEAILNLGLGLQKVKKILVFLPESLQDLLVLLPMLQTLKYERLSSEFCFMGKGQFLPFLSAIFGNAQSFAVDEQGFFWGDPHFKELEKTVHISARSESGFKPFHLSTASLFDPHCTRHFSRAARRKIPASLCQHYTRIRFIRKFIAHRAYFASALEFYLGAH